MSLLMDGPTYAPSFGTSSHSSFSPHEQSPATPSTPTFANAALPNDLLSASVSSILLSSPRAGYTPIHPALSHAWNLRLSPRQPPSPRENSAIQASASVVGSPCFADSSPSPKSLTKREHQSFGQAGTHGGVKAASNCDHVVVKQPMQRSLSPSRERRKYLSAVAAQTVEAFGVGAAAQPSNSCAVIMAGPSDGAEVDRQGLDSPSACECAREGSSGASRPPIFKSLSESHVANGRSSSALVPPTASQSSSTSRFGGLASQSMRSRPAGRPPRPPSRNRQRGPPVVVFVAAVFHFVGSMMGLGTGARAHWGRSSSGRFGSSNGLFKGFLGKAGTLPSTGLRGSKAGTDMRMLPLVLLLLVLFIVLTALQGEGNPRGKCEAGLCGSRLRDLVGANCKLALVSSYTCSCLSVQRPLGQLKKTVFLLWQREAASFLMAVESARCSPMSWMSAAYGPTSYALSCLFFFHSSLPALVSSPALPRRFVPRKLRRHCRRQPALQQLRPRARPRGHQGDSWRGGHHPRGQRWRPGSRQYYHRCCGCCCRHWHCHEAQGAAGGYSCQPG